MRLITLLLALILAAPAAADQIVADTLVCFDEPARTISTVGANKYCVQFIVPDTSGTVRAWGFLNNDADTVWPEAGVLLLDWADPRFPTDAELSSLQFSNVQGTTDTSVVRLDLTEPIDFVEGKVITLVLRTPLTGAPTAIGVGPGFLFSGAYPWYSNYCSYYKAANDSIWYMLTTRDYAWAVAVDSGDCDAQSWGTGRAALADVSVSALEAVKVTTPQK